MSPAAAVGPARARIRPSTWSLGTKLIATVVGLFLVVTLATSALTVLLLRGYLENLGLTPHKEGTVVDQLDGIKRWPCPQFWKRVTISPEGCIRFCVVDWLDKTSLGHVQTHSIAAAIPDDRDDARGFRSRKLQLHQVARFHFDGSLYCHARSADFVSTAVDGRG